MLNYNNFSLLVLALGLALLIAVNASSDNDHSSKQLLSQLKNRHHSGSNDVLFENMDSDMSDSGSDERDFDKRLDYRYGKRLDYRYGKRSAMPYRFGKRGDRLNQEFSLRQLIRALAAENGIDDSDNGVEQFVENNKRLDYRYGRK